MRLATTVFIVLLMQWSFAQDGGEIKAMEVIIEKEADLVLPESSRIFKRIASEKIVFDSLQLTYNTKTLTGSVEPFSLNYAPLAYKDKGVGFKKENFMKFGLGNYNSMLLEGNYHLKTKRIGQYVFSGFYDRYGNGPVDKNQSGFNDLRLNAKAFNNIGELDINTFFNFDNSQFRYYGFQNLQVDPLENPKAYVQSYQIGTEIESNQNDNIYLSLAPTLLVTNFNSEGLSFNEEFLLDVSADIHKRSKKNEWNYGVILNQMIGTYSSSIENQRTQFDIAPFIGLRGDDVTIRTSMMATLAKDSTEGELKSYFYPSLELTWNFENQITIYGNFRSGLEMVTLNSLRHDNLFLNDSLDLKNKNTLADVNIQVSKKFSNRFYGRIGTRIELSENQYFIVNSFSDIRRFELIYNLGTYTKIDFNLLLQHQVYDRLALLLDLHFLQYNTSSNLKAYHLPNATIHFSGRYQFSEKLTFNAGLTVLAGIQGRNTDTSNTTLNPIFDVNFSTRYAVLDNLELFVEAHNLLNQNYERYLNYPSLGLNGKFGFIFRF